MENQNTEKPPLLTKENREEHYSNYLQSTMICSMPLKLSVIPRLTIIYFSEKATILSKHSPLLISQPIPNNVSTPSCVEDSCKELRSKAQDYIHTTPSFSDSFLFFIEYFLYLHFKCYPLSQFSPPNSLFPTSTPASLRVFRQPLTPASLPWHSLTLGHYTTLYYTYNKCCKLWYIQ